MEKKINLKGKLFHRIKYRNSIAPDGGSRFDERLKLFESKVKNRHDIMNKIVERTHCEEAVVKMELLLHDGAERKNSNSDDIQEYCGSCPATSISRFQQKSIIKKIDARGLEDYHPIILKKIMKEVEDEYIKITQQSGIERKLKTVEKKFTIPPYKYLGRTENYSNFLQRRKELQSKFILHQPLIKRIQYECITNLRPELFHLSFADRLEVDEFQNDVSARANEAVQYLQEFYKKIVNIVEQTKAESESSRNYLGACSGLLSVNMSKTISHTLLHIVQFTDSPEVFPYLKLNLTFNDRLILHPTANDIIDIYHNFVNKIINGAKQFLILEKYKIKDAPNKKIHLCLTNNYIDSILDQITSNIRRKFEPILEYIKKLDGEFADIYADLCSKGGSIVTSDLIFDKGCEQILFYKTFLPIIEYIPDKTFFTIGQLALNDYRIVLKQILLSIIDNIFKSLCAQHEWENNDICEAFNIIKIRATQKPTTTEQVIEIGKYMGWVKLEYVNELKERVMENLKNLTKIIQLGLLEETHVKINARAINWLNEILPILDENTLNYEQLKFEAEEKLQKVIEDINVDIKNVYPLLDILDSMDNIENVKTYLNSIILHMVRIREIENQIKWINSEEVSLSFPKSTYPEFEDLKNYVYPFYHLLKLCLDVQRNLSVWLDGQFDLIIYESVKETVENFHKELLTTQKVYRTKLRQAQDENLSLRFKGTVDDPDMLNWPAPLKLCAKAMKLIQDFQPSLSVIKIMCNEALMKRHWAKMSNVAGFDIAPNAGTTLRKIIQIDLKPNMDKYELISIAATKEKELLKNLQTMHEEWTGVNFRTGTCNDFEIITQMEDIETVADDHIIKAINMLNSIFVKPYKLQVQTFYSNLLKISETVVELKRAQSQWLHFQPLFACTEITQKIPKALALYQETTTIYTSYMNTIASQTNNVQKLTNETNILSDLIHCNKLFEQINKGVSDYFDVIRMYFPRMYFLSKSEIFRVLSLTKKPNRIGNLIKNIFTGISCLEFDEHSAILSIASRAGEKVALRNFVPTEIHHGCVEKWLKQLEAEIKHTINCLIKQANASYNDNNIQEWIAQWPNQVSLTVINIIFTSSGHKALANAAALNNHKESIQRMVHNLVDGLKSETLNASRRTIQLVLIALIDKKSLINNLIDARVQNDKDFKWLSQIRYYLIDSSECHVKILKTTVKYGCEYSGDSDQIIITPATRRAFHSLILAYKYHLNGICHGPTGTGKTETVKCLAQALAVNCVFFNCSKLLNFEIIFDFLKGISASGCWLCLEEFENFNPEMISVFAQEIYKISSGLRGNLDKILLKDSEITLNKCFICLNVKATSLPENMKSLFRPVTLTQPDILIITETILFSSGFRCAKSLARKVVTLHKLLADLLPQSVDFGIRTVKEILSKCATSAYCENEEKIVYHAIRSINSTRLAAASVDLFDNILNEIFPGHAPEKETSNLAESLLTATCKNLHLEPEADFLVKIKQFRQVMQYKIGIVLIGRAFTGKTALMNVLQAALGAGDGVVIERQFINPKAMTLSQLYGGIDIKTHEWYDGVITKYLRKHSDEPNWIILDGPIDPIWIDNLSSVLDDTRSLCLASGEVLTIIDNKALIFEIDNLNKASPALASRCGIVYMEAGIIGWQPIMASWIKSNKFEWSRGYEETIIVLFEWLIPPCLQFVKHTCQGLCKINDIHLARTMIQLFGMFLADAYNGADRKEEDAKNFPSWIQAGLIQAAIWGLGAHLNHESRLKFDEFFKQLWKGQNKSHPIPHSIEKIEVSVPVDGAIFDHCYVYKAKGNWKFWPDVLKNEKIEESHYLNDVLIPTTESVKYLSLINMHIHHHYPILLVGPSGTGKSFLINNFLVNKLDKTMFETATLTLTPRITANHAKEIILSKLFKKKSGHYGPTDGKMLVLFIDDVNVPEEDNFGTQPPLELIRKFFDHQHWFHTETCNPIFLENLYFIAAMDASIKNRKLCQRFLRHFNVFSINELSEESITRIYTNSLFTKWKKNGFPSDIISTANQIVTATYHFYQSASILKPTPNWNFYFFNVRNFSKVIQVCSMIRKESADSNKKIFFKQWTHEILRVLGDKLLDKDQAWLFENIKLCVETHFKETLEQLFENLPRNEADEITMNSLAKLIFGTFTVENNLLDRFDESDIDKLEEIAVNCLKTYNKDNPNKFDIVLFEHALKHLSKICRILAVPCSNLLQIGLCGSGRQTLVRLASLIYNQKNFFLEINNNYDREQWRKSFKMFLREAGGHGKPCAFFIREEQIIAEEIFEDIDYLLKVCDIPGLFSLDEKQDILDLVRITMQEKNLNIDDNIDSIFLYHQKQCRENLHIILSFNPSSNIFRKLMRSFSSLREHCEVDYYQSWPSGAFESIAHHWIQSLNIEDEIKTKLIHSISYFQHETRKIAQEVYITTGSYLAFIKVFAHLMSIKQNRIVKIKQRYLAALEKLSFAAFQISEMQKSLADYQPQLEAMTVKAIEMAKQIEKETIEVEKASNLVKKDEAIANEQAAAAQILKLDCEADLAQAIPILEDAISALNTLKPTDITLVKSMKNPPDAIKLVMAAVCVIKDVKPDRIPDPSTGRKTLDYWGPSKRILGDMNFLQTLKDFDKDNIKPEIMVKIRKDYLPHKDFKPHTVAKASSAAEGLCKWIIAMDMYDKVAKEVAPKKEKLEKAEREYGNTMAILNEKKEQVSRIEQKLADLNTLLKEATRKQQKLQRNVDICKKKLDRAQRLIGGLSEEKLRWNSAVERLSSEFSFLPGDVLVSSAAIAYLGPFSKEQRADVLINWFNYTQSLGIPTDPNYEFVRFFEQDFDFDRWHTVGLPADPFFAQSGIMGKLSRRWPLFVDPQNQAGSWIKLIEKENGLVNVKYTSPDYLEVLQEAIGNGNPVLLENVDVIKPFLTDLITKATYFEGNVNYIKLAGRVVEYNDNFTLYLTTNMKRFQYSPELCNRINVINFRMNRLALDEHFLTLIVEVEKPNLRKIKKDLNKLNKHCKDDLNNIEGKILKTLSESKTDILEDEHALQILDESKILFKKIQEKQQSSTHMQAIIDDARHDYQSVAKHSTVLYFSIVELTKINYMYQFSLNWFTDTCIESIQNAHKHKELDRRRISLTDTLTFEAYCKVCRSIFERDKLLFSFVICVNLLLGAGKVSREVLDFIAILNKNADAEEAAIASWLPRKSWQNICELSNLGHYRCLKEIFIENIERFEQIFRSNTPEKGHFPEPYNSNVDKLLIVSSIRPDRLYIAITDFVSAELGKKFANPPTFNISISFMESHVLSPLIFILTPETNPINTSLVLFAKKKHFQNKLILFSPGLDSKEKIELLLEQGRKQGLWICLQNCHIITPWLHYLDLKLEEMDYNNTHENFRLWLTTNESNHFPISLLEKSVKIVKEPPRGFKSKLLDLYTSDPINNKEFYANCPGRYETFSRLLYNLASFHCVIQERRSFRPFGWNLRYEFHESDFNISIHELQSVVNNNINPCGELHYLVRECNYAAHINDKFDNRVFAALLMDYLNPGMVNDSSHIFNGLESYGIPIKTDHQDCINHIMSLPNEDVSTLFGLHENLTQIKQSSESSSILKSLQTVFSAPLPLTETPPNNLSILLEDCLRKLPQKQFDLSEEIALESIALNSVIMEELKSYNKLLKTIKLSLRDLQQMINGSCRITDYLEEIHDSVAHNKVPQLWLKASYRQFYSLSKFLADLGLRVKFFENFRRNPGQNVWLASFFKARAFLLANKLYYSKMNSIQLKDISFQFRVKDESDQCNSGEIFIDGLYIVGSCFNKKENCLDELMPGIIHNSLSTVAFVYCTRPHGLFYDCPLYKDINYFNNNGDKVTAEANLITSILFNTKKPPAIWVKRGSALLCQI